MFLWIILAILTAAVAAILFATLARGGAPAVAGERAGELAVYRDQLAELERDRENGLIRPEEAEYAKAEIGRRLLAAAGGEEADARAAEADGFSSVWIPQVPDDFDALTAATLVAKATERIEIATAVVPVQPRHPISLAQQALSPELLEFEHKAVAAGGRAGHQQCLRALLRVPEHVRFRAGCYRGNIGIDVDIARQRLGAEFRVAARRRLHQHLDQVRDRRSHRRREGRRRVPRDAVGRPHGRPGPAAALARWGPPAQGSAAAHRRVPSRLTAAATGHRRVAPRLPKTAFRG